MVIDVELLLNAPASAAANASKDTASKDDQGGDHDQSDGPTLKATVTVMVNAYAVARSTHDISPALCKGASISEGQIVIRASLSKVRQRGCGKQKS